MTTYNPNPAATPAAPPWAMYTSIKMMCGCATPTCTSAFHRAPSFCR